MSTPMPAGKVINAQWLQNARRNLAEVERHQEGGVVGLEDLADALRATISALEKIVKSA
jgi:hypothetical protein